MTSKKFNISAPLDQRGFSAETIYMKEAQRKIAEGSPVLRAIQGHSRL